MAETDVIVSRSEAIYQISMFLWKLKQESPVINDVHLLRYEDVICGVSKILVGLEDQSEMKG